jgi:glucose/arabinose dehydrogenase
MDISLTPVAGLTGLTNAVYVTNAHDGSNRLFVVEQSGIIRVRQPDGTTSVFLNISSSAPNPAHRRVTSGGEQGLLGLTFHPNYATNGRFYVHHTRSGLSNTNDIVEYQVSSNPNVANPDSERLLLRIPQPFSNHNGGMIEFGPQDGLLYIAKGDGGSALDPGNRAQNINELLGKILRIDVNRDDFPADPNRNYGIPPDNPYAGATPGADEIFAIGMRNPWRFSFDRGTSLLYVGDVGQSTREEIDIVTQGGNYGWRPFEGNIPTPGISPAEGTAILPFAIFPITDLDRSIAQSITGGYVYRGTQSALPVGSYLFADYITGLVFLFHNGVRTTLMDTGFNVSSFGEDETGELYLVRYGGGGIVYKVGNASPNLQPSLMAIPNQTISASQDQVNVTLSATDPQGTPLTYSATARSLALDLDRQLGLRASTMPDNMFGAGEKWLRDRNNQEYFILPNGQFFRWSGMPSATGTLLGTPGSTYHTRLELLRNAQEAFDIDLGRMLRVDAGGLYENSLGAGEKWLLDRNNNWHFILPNGNLHFWNGSGTASGPLIASLGPSYHQLIQLLYDADKGQALATLTVTGTNLNINRDDGFVASLVVTATASDSELTDSKTFTITVTSAAGQPPNLSPIPNQTIPSSQATVMVPLMATDPDGDPITFTATAVSLAYRYDTTLGYNFFTTGDFFQNFLGLNEKWVQSALAPNGWVFILPSGELRAWDGGTGGTTLANVGAYYWDDPNRLIDVPMTPFATLSIMGTTLTVTRSPTSTISAIYATVTASDGQGGTDTESFTITVTASANQPPNLSPIPNQTIPSSQATVMVPLMATDPDGDPITFSATAVSLAHRFDVTLGYNFFTDGNFYQNFLGMNEKWVQSALIASGWAFILPNGQLFAWDGGTSGTLLGNVGAYYWADPNRLIDVPTTPFATLSIMGTTLTVTRSPTSTASAIYVSVTASDGQGGTDTESFTITVTV